MLILVIPVQEVMIFPQESFVYLIHFKGTCFKTTNSVYIFFKSVQSEKGC